MKFFKIYNIYYCFFFYNKRILTVINQFHKYCSGENGDEDTLDQEKCSVQYSAANSKHPHR